ncbi:hypothetical protein LWF01_17025 [Saxibacter everestensis]|uniref:Uncharacterized protein n=1 Tax=Saxibacter everestensis TaxID=2909229 RepID=A0ABY8QTS6_9MICO|nr:hypothetical protein LWF01_17025 [Brevibacteriaceae bacterium ZFBP1038]
MTESDRAQPRLKDVPSSFAQWAGLVLGIIAFCVGVWLLILGDMAPGWILVIVAFIFAVGAFVLAPAMRLRHRYVADYGGTTATLSSLEDVDEVRRLRDEDGLINAARLVKRHHPAVPLKDLVEWLRAL